MQISFLLGAAGSGKTFRCLQEIRNELARDPAGPPLIFLAPKQATFQLERQLFESGEIKGYSRLHIFSFERLARFVFDAAGCAVPNIISEQGRMMVLRALLNRIEGKLLIFGNAARRQGFAEELGRQIREFTNHGLSPAKLRELASEVPQRNALPEKLHDFALLLEMYLDWLRSRSLRDSDALLSAAADLLEGAKERFLSISGLWVDGFAQLTPEERRLLVALVGSAKRSVLAFCVEPDKAARSPISPWFLVSQTVSRCKSDIEIRHNARISVEHLSRDSVKTRFSASPVLGRLEAGWGRFDATEPGPECGEAIRLYECADPEAEAACCAREILKFVRSGGRYREAAVLVRDFNNDYPHILRRVFRRYEIPGFIDNRESVAHHPAAELTRNALRTIAFDWEQRDWFAVLKSGLIRLAPDELDQMENEALANGWKGAVWRQGFSIPDDKPLESAMNYRCERIMPPFIALKEALQDRPSGKALAEALRQFWRALTVEEQLELWARESAEDVLHATVWEQMNSWVDNIELAFGDQELYLRQWMPILEAGLSSLSVGVIPPVLDEVLIGSVDRSRNPDLKLLCILGFNEKIFPAVGGEETLLTEDDRALLLTVGSDLAHVPALKLAAEQFYGYIACTRARDSLRISYSRAAMDGAALNPSRFIAQLQRIFPDVEPTPWNYPKSRAELLHRCELPMLGILHDCTLSPPDQKEKLSPEIALQLYGPNLKLAVSKLERFASCPFRFFVERGLNVEEREEFKLDVREQGSFQHDVLAAFHEKATAGAKQWRELTPEQGRELIRAIAEEQMAIFHNGLLLANNEHRFTAENYQATLQEFIHAIIDWFKTTNRFDPAQVEFGFGARSEIPGWTLELSNGHRMTIEGRVDRLDLYRLNEQEALCLVVDYKSGLQKPDRILVHYGIQQQLTAYLLAVTKIPEIAARLGVKKLRAAGGFLSPLSAQFDKIKTRKDAAVDQNSARRSAYTHNGIFDFEHLKLLDSAAPTGKSGQFYYALTSKGNPYGNSFTVMRSAEFERVLNRTETLIREFGERIYAGDIEVKPYKKGMVTACDKCHMQPICRFDPWTQNYRQLRKPEDQASKGTKEK